MSDFVDLAIFEPPRLLIPVNDSDVTSRGFRLTSRYPQSEQRVQVTDSGTNVESVSSIIKL